MYINRRGNVEDAPLRRDPIIGREITVRDYLPDGFMHGTLPIMRLCPVAAHGLSPKVVELDWNPDKTAVTFRSSERCDHPECGHSCALGSQTITADEVLRLATENVEPSWLPLKLGTVVP